MPYSQNKCAIKHKVSIAPILGLLHLISLLHRCFLPRQAQAGMSIFVFSYLADVANLKDLRHLAHRHFRFFRENGYFWSGDWGKGCRISKNAVR